jgi:hypothetical protein
MAGETATHTVAIARLIVDNKDLGLNWYTRVLLTVQLSSLMRAVTTNTTSYVREGSLFSCAAWSTARSCLASPAETSALRWAVPGTYALSPALIIARNRSLARNRLDNGWIQFTQVRIPRENMLMKWAQLSRDVRLSTSTHVRTHESCLTCAALSSSTDSRACSPQRPTRRWPTTR